MGGTLSGSWTYHCADGSEAFRVLRLDLRDGGKTYRPIHCNRNRWVAGDPTGQLPLYNLPQLAQAKRVYICEGEKCVEAARSIGLVATTSSHGAGSARKTDWAPLAGKEIVILPDNDASGQKYAAEVTAILQQLQSPPMIRLVELPGIGTGGDIVDFLEVNDCRSAQELKTWIEVLASGVAPDGDQQPVIVTVRELLADHPALRPPVIHGLLRRGETMNVIASPKTGKSWLVIDLAIAVASGQRWLGQFQTEKGDVLIIDNELHDETISNRIPKVGLARGLSSEAYADSVFVTSLRGKLKNIHEMDGFFKAIQPGRFKLIIIDALYRVLPREIDENSNAEMAQVYNTIDRYSDRLGCCFVLIHHSSKGNQSFKSVTDMGAGAGSQSRAADAHLALRPHEEDGVVVLEAVVRSWPPPEPICLAWQFPVWQAAPELDPTALKSDKPKRTKKEPEPDKPSWNAVTFTTAFISNRAQSRSAIIEAAVQTGLSERRACTLLDLAVEQGIAYPYRVAGAGNKQLFSTVKSTGLEPQCKIT